MLRTALEPQCGVMPRSETHATEVCSVNSLLDKCLLGNGCPTRISTLLASSTSRWPQWCRRWPAS